MRHRFFGKLNKHLLALQLHVEYMGLFALVTLYEDVDFQNKMRVLIDANITKRRKYLEKFEVKGKLICYFNVVIFNLSKNLSKLLWEYLDIILQCYFRICTILPA